MSAQAEKLIFLIADISGYTRFMVANKQSLIHSQMIITELIQTILLQIQIPFEVAKLEGDAVFLYARKDKDPSVWQANKKGVTEKLFLVFSAFADKVLELSASNLCSCSACTHINRLKLKMVVHSGEALIYNVGKFEELSGVDVILVHRLLKNSISSNEYILMTEPGFQDLSFSAEMQIDECTENVQDMGPVKTFVYQHQLSPESPNEPRYRSLRYKIKNELAKIFYSVKTKFKSKREKS
jgi:hypothetical protein